MTDATHGPDAVTGVTPDTGLRIAEERHNGEMVAADGTPLKRSLNRALRREKLRALALIAPLFLFIVVTFIAPIADMLFRSVENQIVSETLPRTVIALEAWDGEGTPEEPIFAALAQDLAIAVELKNHTRLGSRLNYETTAASSLFRRTGRAADDIGEEAADQFVELDPAWEEPATWIGLMASEDWIADQAEWAAEAEAAGRDAPPERRFALRDGVAEALPRTADMYGAFARVIRAEDADSPTEEDPWPIVYRALHDDLMANPDAAASFEGANAQLVGAAAGAAPSFEVTGFRDTFLDIDEDWADPTIWGTIKAFSSPYTAGYFLSAVDLQLTADGVAKQPEDRQIYGLLFGRTLFMSLTIMGCCVLLGYPVAFLLANLPMRSANVLMILVLLPFWTSLLVRTSAWKVLLQQQGVINDLLVWSGIVTNAGRLALINNQTGTIIAMTHILLPFMILPLYSVMKTIPPSYVRAAKSLGATNFTAFRRVYFPQSVPGIGAGCILVFILSIGYYITPELVGGTTGTFISNRIAYHISQSLNWGLAAALGSILLAVVLMLYWLYDRIVGIDNVSLG
ncbi:ABC transporter permease [uncultured Jannaschia sp.]|uniref:ABC transporter permease n=1 Tax=uncultured Jannaschia sp. TaxID=293347 RepID=UPI0026069FDB|nr:ABC transporter permease [uncultured Jannaschia sp.]